MANLQSSGLISIGNLRTHFGGPTPSSMNQYYKGGSYVPNNIYNASVPFSNNPISLNNFYNATNESFVMSVASAAVNEGGVQTITLTTTNVANGTQIHHRTTGIQSADIVGNPNLDGTFVISGNSASATFTVKADLVSDGGFDNDGYPLANNEVATTTLYTDSSRQDAIGGDYGAVTWTINDTSLSWYLKILQPTISNGIYEVSASANDLTTASSSGYTSADVYVRAGGTGTFKIKGDLNNPSYSVTTELDSSYGSSGRLVTAANSGSQFAANQNVTLYQGNIYSQTSWANNTAEPSIYISRDGTFPTGLQENNTYQYSIRERGRFKLTEIGGTGRAIYSDWCIFKTTHTLEVSAFGG